MASHPTADQVHAALVQLGTMLLIDPEHREDGPTEADRPELLGMLLGRVEMLLAAEPAETAAEVNRGYLRMAMTQDQPVGDVVLASMLSYRFTRLEVLFQTIEADSGDARDLVNTVALTAASTACLLRIWDAVAKAAIGRAAVTPALIRQEFREARRVFWGGSPVIRNSPQDPDQPGPRSMTNNPAIPSPANQEPVSMTNKYAAVRCVVLDPALLPATDPTEVLPARKSHADPPATTMRDLSRLGIPVIVASPSAPVDPATALTALSTGASTDSRPIDPADHFAPLLAATRFDAAELMYVSNAPAEASLALRAGMQATLVVDGPVPGGPRLGLVTIRHLRVLPLMLAARLAIHMN